MNTCRVSDRERGKTCGSAQLHLLDVCRIWVELLSGVGSVPTTRRTSKLRFMNFETAGVVRCSSKYSQHIAYSRQHLIQHKQHILYTTSSTDIGNDATSWFKYHPLVWFPSLWRKEIMLSHITI